MSNKETHLADFETRVFRTYLWNHLSYIFFNQLASLSEELSNSDEKIIFQIGLQNQLIGAKNAVLPEKK